MNGVVDALLVPLDEAPAVLDALAELVAALRQIYEFYEAVHIRSQINL